jgi:hypothetical protein
MTHALRDLLADRFDQQPAEIAIIQNYVTENLKETVAVTVGEQQIVISTRSSALAGALRPHLYELTKRCKTKKRLVIRIG